MASSKEIKQYPEIGGVYKHYKGGKYQVLSMAKHSETQEDLVIYKSIHFGSVYARPLALWLDTVVVKKKKVKRFKLLKNVV